jgi:hypothetical protein
MTVDERAAAEAAVVSTVLDYFEGWFDGDVDRMRRALHPGLAKRSLEQDDSTLNETTAEWMIGATERGRGRERGVGDRRTRSRSRTSTARSRMRWSAPRCTGSTFTSCGQARAGRS